MVIDTNLLKQLREMTQAPLKDCKEALTQSEGDLNRAQEILREKGALQAQKKADRETNEGVVKFKQFADTGKIVGVKFQCETDFVAKNENFQDIVEKTLSLLNAKSANCDSLEQCDQAIRDEITTIINDNLVKLGENIKLSDIVVKQSQGMVYNHPGDKIAAAILFEGEDNGVAKDLCLQVAAMNPEFATVDEVPADQRNELKAQFTAELAESGKPADIIEKIVQGKLSKAFSENVLFEQPSIKDDSKMVKDTIPANFKFKQFIRLAIA